MAETWMSEAKPGKYLGRAFLVEGIAQGKGPGADKAREQEVSGGFDWGEGANRRAGLGASKPMGRILA